MSGRVLLPCVGGWAGAARSCTVRVALASAATSSGQPLVALLCTCCLCREALGLRASLGREEEEDLAGGRSRPWSADLLGGSGGDHTSSCCPASHRPESTGPGQQSDAPGPFWLVFRPGRGGRIKDGGSGGLVAAFAPGFSGTPSRRACAPAKRGRAGPRWGIHGGRQRPARGPRASACSLLAIALVFARAHFGLFQERVHQFAGLRPAALPFSPLLLAGGQRVPVGGATIHGSRLHCACAIQYTAGGVEKAKGT